MKKIVALILLSLLLSFAVGCKTQEQTKMTTLDDLANKKIGVYTGTIYDKFAVERFPSATILRYNHSTDFPLALKTGKIDAAITNLYSAKTLIKANPEISIFSDDVLNFPIGIGFNKNNPALRERFNTSIKADGSYDVMYKRWFSGDADTVVMPKFPAVTNGEKITLAVATGDMPSVGFVKDEYVGFDIELVQTFAQKEHIQLNIISMEFGGLIAALASGKVDMIADCIAINAERQKQVAFSDPYMEDKSAVIALNKNIAQQKSGTMSTIEDVANKRIGVHVGTVYDTFAAARFPAATIAHFNQSTDFPVALKTKKIDVAIANLYETTLMLKANPEIGILTDNVMTSPVAVGFNKSNPALRERFNAFLKTAKADGSLQAIHKKWFESEFSAAKMPQFPQNPNGAKVTLGVAIGQPFNDYINGEYVGLDIELIKTFAQKENLNLNIVSMEFNALIAALAAGKVDMIACCLSITDERKKQVAFSDPYLEDKTAIIALKQNITHLEAKEKEQQVSFVQSVKDGFYNNIIHENRYVLILDGLKITGIISVFSILFGTLLGAGICFLRMSRQRAANLFAQFFISIVRGVPVLVLLMILYYVVFAKIDIHPVLVAVAAFGINFAAYVSEMFRSAIVSIDKGQTEAGIANGFSKVQTFVYIVLPQAIKQVLPVYKGELISLVKMTSIVGYVAVQDLTKASDIIRSRTFDAFFPLIMTALLYFAISWLLLSLLEIVENKTDPKQQRRRTARQSR